MALLAALAFGALGSATATSDTFDSVLVGKVLFKRMWVPAPTRTDAADGLGPLYNARSCAQCHKDGGAAQVHKRHDGKLEIVGAAFRVADNDGATHPWYGRQLQTGAVPGLQAEADARQIVVQPGGEVRLEVKLLGPPLGDGYRLGVRIAPSLRARGLIDRVAESAIRAQGEPQRQRELGLAGRPRMVAANGTGRSVGRFGWKAREVDLENQIADAFALDLGLSSPLRPMPYGDCTPLQTACLAMPNGESAAFEGREISTAMVGYVASYVRTLQGVGADAMAAGEKQLGDAGCTGCHVPRMAAEDGTSVPIYSDLLLHDMGAGLDDGVAEPGVKSAEWRTAPLIDLAPRSGARRYLHDGRGATIGAAIAWHDGEARASRLAFEALAAADRAALIRYLENR